MRAGFHQSGLCLAGWPATPAQRLHGTRLRGLTDEMPYQAFRDPFTM